MCDSMDLVREGERSSEEVADGVYLADLATGERTSMKYWRIDPGATLPTHRHHNEQIGFVISGRLTAIVDGEEIPLRAGDSYLFPSQKDHGAENRSDEPVVGIGVLSPPRSDPDWRTTPHASASRSESVD